MITQMNIRIDKTLHTNAKMFCLKRNILLEEMVSKAMIEYMEKIEKGSDKDNNLID